MQLVFCSGPTKRAGVTSRGIFKSGETFIVKTLCFKKLTPIAVAIAAFAIQSRLATAEEYAGPLLPHVGGQITTAFSNRFGPDAEGTVTFSAITPQQLGVNYASTRGLSVQRNILIADRQSATIYVLGYAANMPLAIPGTTSLGISGASLVELRTTGKTALSLIHDAQLSRIDGQLTLLEKDIKIPVLIEDQVVQVPALHASGVFRAGDKTGTGDFYFLDNKNNPLMLQSSIQFSWEKEQRAERITRVSAGASMKTAMEQSLNTLRRYDLYGIHFDFDKATVRAESAALIKDIALTLKNNPTWTLQINGHTDSIGDPAYNQKLSAARAASVAAAIANEGIASSRLQTSGFGETQPKGDNATLEGRALNRRVELLRTDR
jgi:outer membrane protein OmpA-like peptidoglycan-associated protein